jgi:hypothetical protein
MTFSALKIALAQHEDQEQPLGWFTVLCGLVPALIVSCLICESPRPMSLQVRLATSVSYILIVCLAGALATWIALPRHKHQQFRSLLLCGLRFWIFLPALVLFVHQQSVWAPVIAVFSVTLLVTCFTRLNDAIRLRSLEAIGAQSSPLHETRNSLFTLQIDIGPPSWTPFAIVLCLYAAWASALAGKVLVVTLLLATTAFLLAEHARATQAKPTFRAHSRARDKSPRYEWLILALGWTIMALTVSPGSLGLPGSMLAFQTLKQPPSQPATAQPAPQESAAGYRAIVLWPEKKKEEVLPSPPIAAHASSPAIAKRWEIPFVGPYWYFKAPSSSPGPGAQITRGDPLKVNVRSTDGAILLMKAHQDLDRPIDTSCCREIDVVFSNDPSLGAFAISIVLTDSHAKRNSSQNLGTRPVGLDVVNPGKRVIQKFDQIEVLIYPAAEHLRVGRKIAIRKFVMLPN